MKKTHTHTNMEGLKGYAIENHIKNQLYEDIERLSFSLFVLIFDEKGKRNVFKDIKRL